jgi:rhomboid family GlyGly-CTERM serine protease
LAEFVANRLVWAWPSVAALLALGAALAWPVEGTLIDWQPGLAFAQPWRALSAAFVHFSALHLGANLAGAALVGVLGRVAPVPLRSALAWCAAWPLTQFGLLLRPQLLHYGGLSGVLHAGVAVVAVHLVCAGNRSQRRIGVAIAAVLLLKVIGEAPWSGALRHPAGWDIAVAPLAHASGVAMGALCSLFAEMQRMRRAPTIGA